MKGEERLRIEALTDAHQRIASAEEIGRIATGEQVAASESFERLTEEMLEQITTTQGLTVTERLAWVIAVQRLELNPDVTTEAERYLDKIKRVNKALRKPNSPILIWSKDDLRVLPRAETYVSNGKGLSIKYPGVKPVTIGIDADRSRYRQMRSPVATHSMIAEALLSVEDLEGINNLLGTTDVEGVDEHSAEILPVLVIGEEPIIKFTEMYFATLDAASESLSDSGYHGFARDKYEHFKAVSRIGVEVYDQSEVVRTFVDAERQSRLSDTAARLAFGGIGEYQVLHDVQRVRGFASENDISPQALIDAAIEKTDARYAKNKRTLERMKKSL